MKQGVVNGLALAAVLVLTKTSLAQEAAAPISPPPAAEKAAPTEAAPTVAAPVASSAGASSAGESSAGASSDQRHPAFWANQPGVAFHYVKLARPNDDFVPSEWTRLCLGGCENQLTPGVYRLALSSGAGAPVMAPGTFNVTPTSHFEGAYTDRSGTRLAGALVLGIGGVSSLTTLLAGAVQSGQSYDGEAGLPFIVSGIVGTVLSLAIGIPLAATSDESRVDPAGP